MSEFLSKIPLYDNGFRKGDIVEVNDFLFDVHVTGTVERSEGVYIWLEGHAKPFEAVNAQKMDNVIAPATHPAPATAPAAGGDVVAYTWNGGSIGWDNALDAIEQLVLDCTGSKDTRFLQETLDSIYAIVTTEKAAQASEGGV